MTGPLEMLSGHLTLILLLVGMVVFSLLAAESRKLRSFQFQISIFIVIWIIGEMADILQEEGMISSILPDELGIKIHLAAMIFFCGMVLARFYLARQSNRKLLEEIED